jgi:hypothetical protein
MSEFKPREVPLWEKFARALGFDDNSIQRFQLRRMGEKDEAAAEREAFRTHLSGGGSILDVPLPGANPEVPNLGAGMTGVILAGGGAALPPGIRGEPLVGQQKPPGGRIHSFPVKKGDPYQPPGEPPVAAGYVRVYRGERPGGRVLDPSQKGRNWTARRALAEGHAEGTQLKMRDIPLKQAEVAREGRQRSIYQDNFLLAVDNK